MDDDPTEMDGLTDEVGLTDEEVKRLSALLDEPYREYWSNLGRLIHMFSGVEATLQLVAHRIIGLDDDIGRAALHGLRIDNTKEIIRRALLVKDDKETLSRLEGALAQLSVLSNARNDLVHWGARSTSAGLMVANTRVAVTPAKRKSYIVSATVLDHMIDDLSRIHFILTRWAVADLSSKPDASDGFDRAVREVEQAPWQYTPPPLLRQHQPHGGAPHPRRRRQQDAPQET
ncbi:MAG TPA: hypothetical protein VHW66_14895 [Stellaceae bacterium]|jgi:hypothetical protein|nr:hypothetical protein [Stellaceae bacterium]